MSVAGVKCPRCGAGIDTSPDTEGHVSCPQCGVRLRAVKAAPLPGAPSPATLATAPAMGPALEQVLAEMRALRGLLESISRGQQDILRAVAGASAAPRDAADLGTVSRALGSPPPPAATAQARTRRRQKTVLLVDDDQEARGAATAALDGAQIPVRTVADGNEAIAAIAAQKPDVLVLELGLEGTMPGKDLVNMIKATMEWVDIPILLYTRIPIEGQKEARQIHGADEYVPKGPGSPAALLARVIETFQRV